MMNNVSVGPWLIACSTSDELECISESGPDTFIEKFDLDDPEGVVVHYAVSRANQRYPELIVIQKTKPGPREAFFPNIHITPETGCVFIGAGSRVLCYNLDEKVRLWEQRVDFGFWGWQQFDDVVVMSSELELAAWDHHGRKLWRTFVEPPWHYSVAGQALTLDIMGVVDQFDLRNGPAKQQSEHQ